MPSPGPPIVKNFLFNEKIQNQNPSQPIANSQMEKTVSLQGVEMPYNCFFVYLFSFFFSPDSWPRFYHIHLTKARNDYILPFRRKQDFLKGKNSLVATTQPILSSLLMCKH
jgi:hypothetical protein